MRSARTQLLAVITVAASLLVGCVPSLHPIYTNADLVLEPKLEGTWKEPDTTGSWTISRAADEGAGAYTIIQIEQDGKRGKFIAHLAKIDGKMFLDLAPAEPQIEDTSGFYRMHLLPVHTVVRIDQVEPTLKVTMLDVQWMKEYVQNNPVSIRHEIVNDNVVLTASTAELQAFYLEHLDTEGAYGEGMELTRQAASTVR